ncbi:MAG: WzyE family oligosaccharide polymerase [Arsenophonus sp. NEOnobi-MAG3]
MVPINALLHALLSSISFYIFYYIVYKIRLQTGIQRSDQLLFSMNWVETPPNLSLIEIYCKY